MQKNLRGSWWVAGLLLAVGCRSEQAVFSFRPAARSDSSAAAAAPAAPVAIVAVAFPVTAVPLAAARPVSAIPSTSATTDALTAAPTRPSPRRQRQAAADFRPLASGRAKRPETAARTAHRDTLHWVLGGALVVAGVLGGLLIGGWLGLGVGAALVLLGYYFVVLGLGGRQAWLEVFQEFFNM